MTADEITIRMQAKLIVDRETAETCLKLVEMYVNQTGKNVVVYQTYNGNHRFEFEAGTAV